ncbi:hypothetical protein LTR36_004131 [Oleoguttula mirabilis]|uniref:C3H1-type domain-containing protein n=1 Tax=Oleoguttula mirabilis TaxID=1507867 RepID=A0AAV9JHJ5_9PEZI|nr:hypothetical protein LTR36_004131 [Oleoguttula mirabilis]
MADRPSERPWVLPKEERPLVHVDWEAYGICLYSMLGPDRCYSGERCRFVHPPKREISRLWNRPEARLQYATRIPRAHIEDYGRATDPPPVRQVRGQEILGVYGPNRAPPPPPDHPVSAPKKPDLVRIDRPQVSSRERPSQHDGVSKVPEYVPPTPGAPRPARAELPAHRLAAQPSGNIDNNSTRAHTQIEDRGRQQSINFSFAATSIDAPPSPGAEAYGGIRRTPGSNKPHGDTAPAPFFGDPMTKSSNRQPLGRPNRMFERASGHATDSSSALLSLDVPTASARTVWRRADSGATPQNDDRMQDDEMPRQQSAYWQRLKAKQAAQETGGGGGKEEGSEGAVQIVPPRGAPEARFSQPTRDEAEIRPMPPPPRPTVTLAGPYTSTTPPPAPAPKSTMGATKRLSNGDPKPPIGPHPSTIRVAAPYTTQACIEKRLLPPTLDHQERSLGEAREDSNRLQGVTWLDNVRRALQLPVRTLGTACVLYHKFRLMHPGADYAWADAAAASLLAACKIEDTLKKSKDILAAAYNLKAGSHEALGADDVVFEAPSRAVIGLERLVLEAGGFDFRSKDKHQLLVKINKRLPATNDQHEAGRVAFTVMTDLHRTFAPLKHTSATQAIACLELASHLHATTSAGAGSAAVIDQVKAIPIGKWSTTRENIMETLLDLLDLYTHHTTATILGTKYSLDDFLRIRLALNKECSEHNIPRYQTAPESVVDRPAVNGATLQVANGHPTPVSPPQPGAQAQSQPKIVGVPSLPEGGGTLRFILNPRLAAEEKAEVQKFFVEEWEEYEEEIEIPLPRPKSPERIREREKDREKDREKEREKDRPERTQDARPPTLPAARARDSDKRSDGDDRRSLDRRSREDLRERDRDRDRDRERDRERDRTRERDREVERERARTRDRERDRRYDDDRRYDERDRYERRDRRSYDDYDRRRERR